MLHWALVFFAIALVASLLGFGGIAGMSAEFGYIFAILADLRLKLLRGERARQRRRAGKN